MIVPVYYGEKYIPGLIRQVECCKEHLKSEDCIEILFVNDAPGAPLTIGWKSKIVEIKVINSNRNIGIHGARLKGLSMCKGEYILFLDQDDKIKPEYFESQMQKLGSADAVVCRAIHENRELYDANYLFEHVVSKQYTLTIGNGIKSPGQVLLKKECISSIWKRNQLFHNGADDWFLWICMMSEGKAFALNDAVLYEHVVNGENNTGNFLEMSYSEYEMAQILEEESLLDREELKALKDIVNGHCQKRIQMADKYMRMYYFYCAWLQLCRDNCSLASHLKAQGYKTAAIYGDGYFGKQLYKELMKEHIDVLCFIDRNAEYLKEEIPVYKPEEKNPDVDVIVITVLQDGKGVAKLLRAKNSAKIVCLDELLEETKNKW